MRPACFAQRRAGRSCRIAGGVRDEAQLVWESRLFLQRSRCLTSFVSEAGAVPARAHEICDTLGIEPRASRMLSGCDNTTPCARCRQHRCCVNYALLALGLVGCVRWGPRSTHPRTGEHLRPCRPALRSSPIARSVAGRYRAKRVRNNALSLRLCGCVGPVLHRSPRSCISLGLLAFASAALCSFARVLVQGCVYSRPCAAQLGLRSHQPQVGAQEPLKN